MASAGFREIYPKRGNVAAGTGNVNDIAWPWSSQPWRTRVPGSPNVVQLHARKSRIRHSRRYQPSGAAVFDICVSIESVRANGAAHSTLRWQLMFIKSCADMQHQFQQAQAHKRVTHACMTKRVRNQTILMRHACDFFKTSRWNRIRRHFC